jgi:hypothetical protein
MPLSSPYADNAPHFAPAATVGFKLSKPGYDASRTAGQNFVFDSSWPSLPIAFETTIPNTITSSISKATIAHNLKFAPLVFIWAYFPDPSGVGNVCRRFIAMADINNIYLNGNTSSTPPFNATILKIRAFQLDLTKDVDYSLAPGDTFNSSYDPNFGVKVVKPGKDINSRDMRDFALHSRCQSPLILAVKTQQTMAPANPNVVQYTSALSYPVWVYGLVRLGNTLSTNLGVPVNTYLPAPYYSQAYPKTFTDGIKSYLQYNSGVNGDNGATLVILRDPMFAANPVTVQY